MRFFFLITVFIYCLQFNHLQAEQIYAKYEVGFWEVKLNKNIVSDTVIYLKSSACIGKCKSYSLLVLSNGDTYLNALENMFLQGYFEYSLSKSQLKLLKKRLDELNWEKYAHIYPKNEVFLDGLPTFIIGRSENHADQKIICQYDCPKEIMHIIDYLEGIIPNLEWKPVII